MACALGPIGIFRLWPRHAFLWSCGVNTQTSDVMSISHLLMITISQGRIPHSLCTRTMAATCGETSGSTTSTCSSATGSTSRACPYVNPSTDLILRFRRQRQKFRQKTGKSVCNPSLQKSSRFANCRKQSHTVSNKGGIEGVVTGQLLDPLSEGKYSM